MINVISEDVNPARQNLNRKPIYDYIKVIAIFFVLCYHCKTALDISGRSSIACLINDMVFKMGVPLFFFVSGALMLCKERKIEYFLRKEAKILFLILFWATCSTICCMFYVNKIHIGGGKLVDIQEVINHVWHLSLYYCNYMWFLCTLFALYSITPFFSCYLKGGRKNILYTLFFATLFSSLTALTWKLNPIKNGAVCASSLLYYIMGFLIFKTDIIKLKIRYAFFIIPATICFYLIYLFYGNEKLGNSYQSIFGVAYISCIVFLMRFINLKANNIIEFIGKRTLAIYVLQGPIYKAFDKYLPQIHEIGIIYPVIVLCTCLGITYVFEKNKITKFIISI